MQDWGFLSEFLAFKKSIDVFIADCGRDSLSDSELMLFSFTFARETIQNRPVQINNFNNSNVRLENAMSIGDDRSVKAGNITNSIVQTGDHSVASLAPTRLPEAASVEIEAVVAELRAVLAAMGGADAGKVGRALDDAAEEVAKPEPDKAEVAGILTRALDYAKKTADFTGYVDQIKPLVVQVAGWVGAASPYVAPLLAAVGLSVGLP